SPAAAPSPSGNPDENYSASPSWRLDKSWYYSLKSLKACVCEPSGKCHRVRMWPYGADHSDQTVWVERVPAHRQRDLDTWRISPGFRSPSWRSGNGST